MATTTTTTAINEYKISTDLQNSGGANVGTLETTISKNTTAGSEDYGKVTMKTNLYVKNVTDDADCAELLLTCTGMAGHVTAVQTQLNAIKTP